MPTTVIAFNNGNPFAVGPAMVRSSQRILPSTINDVWLNLLDPNGDWVNPANAGGNFVYGIEYSPDGGFTWLTLVGNGGGQPVGSLNKDGSLPSVHIGRDTGIAEAYGKPCRAFASCTPQTITIGASASVT